MKENQPQSLSVKTDIIKRAINNGDIISLVYHSGSTPGESRQILPRHLDYDMVRAVCLRTHKVKNFFLDKIDNVSIVETDSKQKKDIEETTQEAKEKQRFYTEFRSWINDMIGGDIKRK